MSIVNDQLTPDVTTVLVIEQYPITRYGLEFLIQSEPTLRTAGEESTGAGALVTLSAKPVDVVVLGIDLPDMSGLDLARELRDRYAGLGIVILTKFCDDDDVLFRALETGASAFVGKTAPVAEIVAAIRHSAVAPLSFSASGLSEALNRRLLAPPRPLLSKREDEVLRLLHAGYSVPQIASTLYVSLSTAKTYVTRLYDKLGATNRTQALMTAVRHGLVDAGLDSVA